MSQTSGKDDRKYLALMSRYKELRMQLGPKALPYLEAAMKLREEGDVSEDVILGAAYM
jgi:hypothetical protein